MDIDVSRFKTFGTDSVIHDGTTVLNPEQIRIGHNTRIDSFTKLEGGEWLWIGSNVHIASFSHINSGGGKCFIASGVGIASGVKILSGHPDLSSVRICPNDEKTLTAIRYMTAIHSFAFLCTNSVVQPGVTIGRAAIIMSGAVVTKDVKAYEIVAGIPAKVIGSRLDDPSFKDYEGYNAFRGNE